MIRSTRAQKAERLRAARRLLADETGTAEAAMALSRAFGLSRRRAYRYLELARAGAPASRSRCRGASRAVCAIMRASAA
jgi:predicted DNA-binding transcriptional regulator YafY